MAFITRYETANDKSTGQPGETEQISLYSSVDRIVIYFSILVITKTCDKFLMLNRFSVVASRLGQRNPDQTEIY